MSATKWVHKWVVRKIASEQYDDAVQTLEMTVLLKQEAVVAGVDIEIVLKKIAPTTLEQYLEDMLDDAVNIEDSVLVG